MLLQVSSYCSPNASSCYEALSKDTYGCRVSCTGLYADVEVEVEDDSTRQMFGILAANGELLSMFTIFT